MLLTHLPTGITVHIDRGRSQRRNKEEALRILRARLLAAREAAAAASANEQRKKQIGSGMRGDKRRTVRVQHRWVTDHVLGRKMRLSEYLSGGVFGSDQTNRSS